MLQHANNADNQDVSPWLETLRLMASEMGPKRPFQTSLTSLLRKLSERHGFLRPHIVLFDPETGMLRLSLADTQPKANHASYAPGVGVTGQVFAIMGQVASPQPFRHRGKNEGRLPLSEPPLRAQR